MEEDSVPVGTNTVGFAHSLADFPSCLLYQVGSIYICPTRIITLAVPVANNVQLLNSKVTQKKNYWQPPIQFRFFQIYIPSLFLST